MLNLGSVWSNQSKSSTPGKPTNGGLVLKYFLSETIHAKENGSRGTHFAKFLISNFLKGLTYSALGQNYFQALQLGSIHLVLSTPTSIGIGWPLYEGHFESFQTNVILFIFFASTLQFRNDF